MPKLHSAYAAADRKLYWTFFPDGSCTLSIIVIAWKVKEVNQKIK